MAEQERISKQPYEVTYRPEKSFPYLDDALDIIDTVLSEKTLPAWKELGVSNELKPNKLPWELSQGFLCLKQNEPESLASTTAQAILRDLDEKIAACISVNVDAPPYTRVKILTSSLYGIVISDIFETKISNGLSFREELANLVNNPEEVDVLSKRREERLRSLEIDTEELEEQEDTSPRRKVTDACNELFLEHRVAVVSQNMTSEDINTRKRYLLLAKLHNLMQQKDGDTIFSSFSTRLQQGFSTGAKAPRAIVEGLENKLRQYVWNPDSIEKEKIDPISVMVIDSILKELNIASEQDLFYDYLSIQDEIRKKAIDIARRSYRMAAIIMGEHLVDFFSIVENLDESQGFNPNYYQLKLNTSGKVFADFIDTPNGNPPYREWIQEDVSKDTAITRCPAGNMFAGSKDFNENSPPQRRLITIEDNSAYSTGQVFYHTMIEIINRYDSLHQKNEDGY